MTRVSFAAYYREHESELARDNPFSGCRFYGDTPDAGPNSPRDYVPKQPTDIFNLLLGHTTYVKRRDWHLRPLAAHEQVIVQN